MTKTKQKPPEKMTKAELVERVRFLESRDTMWARQLASIWDSYRWITRRRDRLEAQLRAIREQLGVSKGLDAITFDQITRNFLDLSVERDEYVQHLRSLLPDAETRKHLQGAIALAEIDLPTYDRTKEAERANNAVHKSQAWLDRLEREAEDGILLTHEEMDEAQA